MKIKKQIITEFNFPYAVATYDSPFGKKVMVATEYSGKCVSFKYDGNKLKTVWEGPGGTMTIFPFWKHGKNSDKEEFYATQKFFKGFNAKESELVYFTIKGNMISEPKTLLKLPYLHRFCIFSSDNITYFVGATLCKDKEYKEDWSQPGSVYVGLISEDLSVPFEIEEILGGITKNHGMYLGRHNEIENVVIVSGSEGVFELIPPMQNNMWNIKKLLSTEVSEVRLFDIDEDGVDELITIEKFHGDRLCVYKEIEDQYQLIYSYPIAFGHALWCGKIFSRNSILIGYKESNAALILLQVDDSINQFSMLPTIIDQFESPSNLDVIVEKDSFDIFAACSSGKVIKYTLTK